MTSIPAALRVLLESCERDLLNHPDPDEVVAESIDDIFQVLLDQTGMEVEELLDIPAIVDPLGGVPRPRRDIPIGTLRSIERQSGVKLRP